jgi:hypothetical protein
MPPRSSCWDNSYLLPFLRSFCLSVRFRWRPMSSIISRIISNLSANLSCGSSLDSSESRNTSALSTCPLNAPQKSKKAAVPRVRSRVKARKSALHSRSKASAPGGDSVSVSRMASLRRALIGQIPQNFHSSFVFLPLLAFLELGSLLKMHLNQFKLCRFPVLICYFKCT